MLQIHNSLTGRKDDFRPIVPGHVGMYVCGMTVYDHIHVGHARSQIAFDVVRRWLTASGYKVKYVRNITDIDDKIILRARERNEAVEALTERYIASTDEDLAALGVLKPDHEPRATAYVREIVRLIETLIQRGFAYVGTSGDVLYAVARFQDYGRLSGRKLADLRAGARVEVDESKRDPLDFVLWKRAKPGEPAWDSPWGAGRPGWHIECSAMAIALLGKHFDIHGGGMDLKFPHHENEIAQSCAACDAPFANVWMHNGFVRVDDEKMSKSLGNFFTVRDVLPRLRPEVLRAFLVSSHYRGPVNYTEENLRQADAVLQRFYLALRDTDKGDDKGDATLSKGVASPSDRRIDERDVTPHSEGDATPLERVASPFTQAFAEAMDDDFNTPEALAALQGLARELNVAKTAGDRVRAGTLAAELRRLGSLLGILEHEPAAWLGTRSELTDGGPADSNVVDPAEIERLLQARIKARQNRNWAESDRIRSELNARGVLLEDSATGTTWRWK
jgi:cysteinyl-tRNA synthetase